ncbi:hypothetical protein X777_06864, partial [Ooceraea biroi]
ATSSVKAFTAWYTISNLIAKNSKPFCEGKFVNKCLIAVVESFGNSLTLEEAASIPLNDKTVKLRIDDSISSSLESVKCDELKFFSKIGEEKEEAEKLLKGIALQGGVEKVIRIRTEREEWGDMILVTLGSIEERNKIMEGKRKLKGSNIWIEEDLSWEERRERWVMRKIAMEEERKGNRVWRGNRKIRINEEWWWWDEELKG